MNARRYRVWVRRKRSPDGTLYQWLASYADLDRAVERAMDAHGAGLMHPCGPVDSAIVEDTKSSRRKCGVVYAT